LHVVLHVSLRMLLLAVALASLDFASPVFSTILDAPHDPRHH
jgi:hypothetical protein